MKLRRVGWGIILASLVGAAAAGARAAPTPIDSSFEAAFTRQPRPAQLLLVDGRAFAAKEGPDGSFPDTVNGRKGALAVESLRRAYNIVAAGVVSTGPERARLLDQGLKAFEWGFDQAGPDGSFPNERGGVAKKQNSLHPKSEFIEAAAHSLLLIQQAGVDMGPRYAARVATLAQKLQRSARWMASSRDLDDFFGRAKNTNQLLFIATGLQEAGLTTRDPSLMQRAEGLVRQILARQTPDGVFPEGGGFDSNYQTVSLELLGRYASTLPDSSWRATVLAAVRKGTDRFLGTINASGAINAGANTRTVACGAPVAGTAPKGRDIDIVPLRLYYLGYLLGDETRLDAIADSVQTTGQSFTHSEKCGDGGGEKPDKRAKKQLKGS